MNINFEQINDLLENLEYFASKELQYATFLGLLNFNAKDSKIAQDIYATCLEGPPGAGKTFYAETYVKLAKKIFNEDVLLVEYQCDATTGKTELFEDINISAAIRSDADNVNIPGKLIEAINEVNKGKKVVLFLDEYDKAREETDAFLLQFLQSGKINSTQFGDLKVLDQYKNNLQVIICKNDFRVNLSGPLSRRVRIIRLDYMKPKTFHKVANDLLINKRKEKVSPGLINLVLLIYNTIYEKKDLFVRIPSCSEMLLAIIDADSLIKYANAPKNIVYNTIINGLFKQIDDILTFETGLDTMTKSTELSDLIKEMKSNTEIATEESLNEILVKTFLEKQIKMYTAKLEEQSKELNEKIDQVSKIIEEYSKKVKQLNDKNQELPTQIKFGDDALELITEDEALSVFDDETDTIKRGKSIFDSSKKEFVSIASITLSKDTDNKEEIEYAKKRKIVIYENGFQLLKTKKLTLISSKSLIEGKTTIKLFADTLVLPSKLLNFINEYLTHLKSLIEKFELNCLVYDDVIEKSKTLIQVKNFPNTYKITLSNIQSLINELSNTNYNCNDENEAVKTSDKILSMRR